MPSIAVAGGLGDLGRLIVDALYGTGKYEVYIMSRKMPKNFATRTSPLTGKTYLPLIQTDYSSESEVTRLLVEHNIDTVICTFALDFQAASDSQVTLIRAAEKASAVKRFIPSEFNVDYDLGDDILPYPDKKFHAIGRRELEKTNLEFSYIYPGMFMDYFGMPNIDTHLRNLYVIIDPANGVAYVPGDGNAKMAMSFTKDVARYVALALELDKWPRVMTTVSSTMTLKEIIDLTEKNLGGKLEVTYQSISALLKHENLVLPGNIAVADHFPEGLKQLKALTADLEASIALGAYDFDKLPEHLNLVDHFAGKTEVPTRIENIIEMAWKRR
ncbi:NmrA-like family protein [Dactylonectria macrodidyma]|uniref:NmrA-like family protein n=1 Tax=Dactylonectria macrodidyma TaxID=307937 RepID=A0A9P9IU28_9HYPO|nr:NmrA-like family protein [Dactylonectria macrodidyma]